LKPIALHPDKVESAGFVVHLSPQLSMYICSFKRFLYTTRFIWFRRCRWELYSGIMEIRSGSHTFSSGSAKYP